MGLKEESSAADTAPSTDSVSGDYWQSHYDSMAHHASLDLFAAEARDYFASLERAVRLEDFDRVLDFGCGLGFVSGLLATRATSLFYWDYSENMLETARSRLANIPNARAVDLSLAGSGPDQAGNFDLIVVNSVIQYMSEEDLSDWLGRWKGMLSTNGVLVVSDLILPRPAFFAEVYDSLIFSAKEGFLVRTLLKNFAQYARYLKARRDAPMTRYSKERFLKFAETAGFSVTFLPENLTYRTNRYSVELRPLSD